MGYDIISKGHKIYQLKDYRHRICVDYTNNLRDYFKHKIVWVENFLLFSYMFRKKGVIPYIFLIKESIFITITPFLFIFNLDLHISGILLFLNIYFSGNFYFLIQPSISNILKIFNRFFIIVYFPLSILKLLLRF